MSSPALRGEFNRGSGDAGFSFGADTCQSEVRFTADTTFEQYNGGDYAVNEGSGRTGVHDRNQRTEWFASDRICFLLRLV